MVLSTFRPFILPLFTRVSAWKANSRNCIFRILHRTSAQSHKVRSSAHPPPVSGGVVRWGYKRMADQRVSTTDPDASPMH